MKTAQKLEVNPDRIWKYSTSLYGLFLCLLMAPPLFGAIRPLVETGSSPSPVGAGVRSLGMGEAFVAVADDASAGSWNPAGLTQLEQREVSFVLAYETRNDDITSKTHPEATGKASVDRSDIHYLSFVQPFTWRDQVLAFSLNYQRVYAFEKKAAFPYTLNTPTISGTIDFKLEQEGDITAMVPALAWAPNPHFSLGLSLFLWGDGFTGGGKFSKHITSTGTLKFNAASLGAGAGTVNLIDTLDYKQAYTVDTGLSFNLGGMWRVNPLWKIGAVLKPSFTLDLDQTTNIRFTQVDSGNGTVYNNVTSSTASGAEITFPTVFALGAARQFADIATLSLDLTYTHWPQYKIQESGLTLNPVSGTTDESDPTLAIRLGGEILWLREKNIVPFRMGFGLDPEPAVGGQDLFYTASVGTGINWKNVILDWSTQVRFGFDVGKSAYQGVSGQATVTQVKSVAGMSWWF